MFIDDVELDVTAGKGGDGAVSFRRERYVPRGGPDGGDGGRGGSVVVAADGRLRTLNHLAGVQSAAADAGGNGGGNKRAGRAGADRPLRVPLGTEVSADGRLLGEVLAPGDRVVVARGGAGGRGNARFASATVQAPRYAEKGTLGESRRLRLTLKLIADVAIVGPPNAGKSSLLAAFSSAHPKVAAYPFTTLAPQLGIVSIPPGHTFAAVEVPGLLEGAAEGKGLGHDFLRHVERARALVVLVDLAGPDPRRDFAVVMGELAGFNAALPARVRLVVANKTDLPYDAAALDGLRQDAAARGLETWPVSALTGDGVAALVPRLWEIASTP